MMKEVVCNLPENFLFVDSPIYILDAVVNNHTGIDVDSRLVSSRKNQQFENNGKHNYGVHPGTLTLAQQNLKANIQHIL